MLGEFAVAVDRTLASLCEVLDLYVEWLDHASVDLSAEAEALAALRAFIASRTPATAARVDAACGPIYPAESVPAPRRELRRALFAVAGAACARQPLAPEQVQHVERVLLALAPALGAAGSVREPGREARVALERGRREGRRDTRYPEPGFARQLAVGALLAQYRDLGRVSQAALCDLAAQRGLKVSKANLARLEAGVAWKAAPVDDLAQILGVEPGEFYARADRAHEMAAKLSRPLLGAGMDDEVESRWFAALVATYGDAAARACVRFAAAGAVKARLPGGL